MVTDVLAAMDSETKRASERASGNFTLTFLRLNDGQKAKIRPLFNLSQCVVLAMHSKFNQADPKQSVNAVCGTENGGECLHCDAAKAGDKKLVANTVFFLPVYVSVIEAKNESGIWTPVTYQRGGVDMEVNGLRILELKAFGTIGTVLQFLRSLYSEDKEHDIRQYGLIMERVGAGQPTKYTILPKGPTPMPEPAKIFIPTQEAVRQMILSACPPAGTTVVSSAPAATSSQVSEKDNDF